VNRIGRRSLLAGAVVAVLAAGVAVVLAARPDQLSPSAVDLHTPGSPVDPPSVAGSPSVVPSGSGSPSVAPSASGRTSKAGTTRAGTPLTAIRSWAYQLQDYSGDRLDKLAAGPYQLVVVDLARDAHQDWFTAAEIARVRATGKRALAYFEIGSIEDFRPEYPVLRRDAADLIANEWQDWPGEYFVRYYDERWWRLVVQPRVEQALKAGFDGVYLDTPLAYEEIDLDAVQGRDRTALAKAMTALIVRISRYAKAKRPGFLIVPQNSPELRHQAGYTAAIDGIGMEELFFQATDERCTEDFCAENLAETRALRAAGKFVLSVDYASKAADITAACSRYRTERFAGTVTVLDLDRPVPPCP
jgi:cysteinyl-tRNA synthetase